MSHVLPLRDGNADSNGVVIASAPIVAMLRDVRSEATTIKRWSPNSDVAIALELVCDKLERALREAQRTDVWLTVEQVEGLSHRPRSTITRICRDHRAQAGAHKVKGVWAIHWPTFEAFIMRGQTHNEQEAA